MNSKNYGIVFIVLAVASFLFLTMVCPMIVTPQESDGTSVNYTCINIPYIEIILPIVFLLVAVYFFMKEKRA